MSDSIETSTIALWHSKVVEAINLLNQVPCSTPDLSHFYPHGEDLSEAKAYLRMVASRLDKDLLAFAIEQRTKP
jgi:hypothetical protein